MEFSLSTAEMALRDSLRRFCRDHYSQQIRASLLQSRDQFGREHWGMFAELGWLGAALPADVGGGEGGVNEIAIISEEFGRALVVEPFWACAVVASHLINRRADHRQRVDLLAPLVRGAVVVVLAHSEEDAGGLIEHVETRAERHGDGIYCLNGKKTLIVSGSTADKFIVSARTQGGSRDRGGIGLFLVDRSAVGLSRFDYVTIDGMAACNLDLHNVRVREADRIGGPDSAFEDIEETWEWGILALCAEAVGIMDGVLWITRDYLRMRRQYGVALASFQALQHRMADMYVELELARSMLFRAISLLDLPASQQRHGEMIAAYIKVCQSGGFVCRNGIQLHGAMGMVEGGMVGQYFKRMVVISGLFGGTEKQLQKFIDLTT